MVKLFNRGVSIINENLKNVFEVRELNEKSTIRNFLIVQSEITRNY